jgi:hypothetical protein
VADPNLFCQKLQKSGNLRSASGQSTTGKARPGTITKEVATEKSAEDFTIRDGVSLRTFSGTASEKNPPVLPILF